MTTKIADQAGRQPPTRADAAMRGLGHAEVNRAGALLALEMLDDLEGASETGHPDAGPADVAQLEDWARQGLPFRNVVAEYLSRAQAQGADVVEGFCAVLSDSVAMVAAGGCRRADDYRELLELDEGDE